MMDIFERDVYEAKINLKNERMKGFWKKLFTLGIINNDSKIGNAEINLNNSSQDLNQCRQLKKEASDIDQYEESIQVHGIRISKHTFADINILGRESYPQEWEQLRQTILERDNFSCQEEDGYCQGPLQIHHIIELSKGGTNNPGNLVALCKYHHSMRHPHMQRKL